MNQDYDGDIKIYKKSQDSEASDFDGLAKKIDFHKENGNNKKAQFLGEAFANLKPTDPELGLLPSVGASPAAILYQARVLITFLCGRAAKEELHSQILIDTAINTMYDWLKENEAGYYNNITDGAAFSFYRLALKKEGDKAQSIGKEFAKLCASPKDEELIELGSEVYIKTLKHLRRLIADCKFKY